MKYYVLHHSPLTKRKQYLEHCFKLLNIEPTWVTGFLPDEIKLPAQNRFVNIREYSLYLKHAFCYEDMIKNNIEIATIFEDDVVLWKEYRKYEEIFLKEFRELKGDIMFHGTCCEIEPYENIEGKHVYYHPDYRTRCAHCYMVTLNAVNKIVKHWYTNPKTPDHFLNEMIEKEGLRSCYTRPAIQEGVYTGVYKSSIKI